MEGLTSMLKKEESYGHIKGVAVCRGAPRISHLLFADDNIVFCRASLKEASRVMKLLEDYEGDSGQRLNKEKTSLFFSKNTSREVQDQVNLCLEPKLYDTMRGTLGCRHLCERGKGRLLTVLKIWWEEKLRVGKESSFPTWGGRFLLKLWPKPLLPTL